MNNQLSSRIGLQVSHVDVLSLKVLCNDLTINHVKVVDGFGTVFIVCELVA